MKNVISDLVAEQSFFDSVLAGLSESQWRSMSANCEWTIKEELLHIAAFDHAALRMMEGDYSAVNEVADVEFGHDSIYRPTAFTHMTGEEAMSFWREQRTRMVAAFYDRNPKDRIAWAPGLPMSAKSLVSARLMELWAHSVDIYDALGLEPSVQKRIEHTLFLSWQALPNAYRINGFDMPDVPIRLEVELPDGELWTRGEENPDNWIKGTARDWALTAVRRRHYLDTDLEVHGEEATRYAAIVQTFAGEPSTPPPAGTHKKASGLVGAQS